MSIQLQEIVFIDIEASSLRDGFPVEVGWAWVEGRDIYSESLLISPADEWLAPGFVWDQIAEGLHGIPLKQLERDGVSPVEVCSVLNEFLKNKTAVFDTGPDGLDRHWLDLLFLEGSLRRDFRLGGSANEVLISLATGCGLENADLLQIKKRAPEATHRAAADAAHYAWCAAAIDQMANSVAEDNIEKIARQISVRGIFRS